MKFFHKIYIVTAFSFLFLFSSCEKEISVAPEDPKPEIGESYFIESNPSGAAIFIDDKNTGFTTPDTVKWLDEGVHKLSLKLDLFADTSIGIKVNKGRIDSILVDFTTNYSMRGSLNIDSNPRSAFIIINDSSYNLRTPANINNLLPGKYKIKFQKSGYWDDEVTATVQSRQTRYTSSNLEDTATWVAYNQKHTPIPTNYTKSVAIEKGYIKWIGTFGEGLVRYDDSVWTVYNITNSPLPGNIINKIVIEPGGKKWICTMEGLASFDDNNWTVFNMSNSALPSNLISTLAIDGNGHFWIGTLDKGIVYYDGVNWTVYNKDNSGLPNNTINDIEIELGNIKWIGTNGSGMVRFDNNTWQIYHRDNTGQPSGTLTRPGFPNNNILTIAISPANVRWLGFGFQNGASGGVARRLTLYWRPYIGIPSDEVMDIAFDINNKPWFANLTHGLSTYEDATETWHTYNTSNSKIGSNDIMGIAIDPNNDKWIATNGNGLIKYKAD